MTNRLLHFLLVEDDDDHAHIVTRTFERSPMGNTIDRVSDGEQALAYMRHTGGYTDRPRPDVVLLDLKLPKMDGHEVLSHLKDDPQFRTIPVVVLSTSTAEVDRLQAYEHHANSYLVKPVDFERFRQLVNDLATYWAGWNEPPPKD